MRDGPSYDEWLTTELAELVLRGARSGHEFAFLARAPLETVATSLGVHAHAVDRAREHLRDPARRDRLEREFVRASQFPPPAADAAGGDGEKASPSDHEELIAASERHPLGVDFLVRAPLETAAIAFGVHPDVVSAARARLAARAAEPGDV